MTYFSSLKRIKVKKHNKLSRIDVIKNEEDF